MTTARQRVVLLGAALCTLGVIVIVLNSKREDASVAWAVLGRRRGRRRPEPRSGLSGLADRVAALDGTITVDSPPGAGTRVRAEIPYGRQAPKQDGLDAVPGAAS